MISQDLGNNHLTSAYIFSLKDPACFFCRFHNKMVSAAGFRTHINQAANSTSEENTGPLNNYTELEPRCTYQDFYCRYIKGDLTSASEIFESEIARDLGKKGENQNGTPLHVKIY